LGYNRWKRPLAEITNNETPCLISLGRRNLHFRGSGRPRTHRRSHRTGRGREESGFSEAIATIGPVANAIIKKVQSLNEPADEVEVKFGLKMSAELGAAIASGNAEVNYEITLKWTPKVENEYSVRIIGSQDLQHQIRA